MLTLRQKRQIGDVFSYMLLLVCCVIFFGPILWIILMSFKTEGETYAFPPTFLPENLFIGNYISVFSDPHMVDFIVNSVTIAVIGTAIAIVVAVFAGFAISRYRFVGNFSIFMLVLILRMVPPIGLIIPLYTMVRVVGLIDTKMLLIILDVAVSLPSAIWILAVFFRLIPQELEDAAKIDGCSHLGVLRNVVIPLSIPSIATVTIFTFVAIWNEYLYAATFTLTDRSRPLTVFLAELLQPEHQMSWGDISAVATLIALPTLLIAIVLQRYIVSGLLTGAVKG